MKCCLYCSRHHKHMIRHPCSVMITLEPYIQTVCYFIDKTAKTVCKTLTKIINSPTASQTGVSNISMAKIYGYGAI